MGGGVGLFLARNLNHPPGDERSRDARAEEVLAFVNRASLNQRKNKIARELLPQIVDINLRRAGRLRLGSEALQLLLLANIGAKGNQLRVVFFLDPRKQHRGIEAARIRQNNFHLDCKSAGE